MSPSKIAKMLARRVVVSWRDQPTRYDIEALQANAERVGLVIRTRWILVAALGLYSVLGAWAYSLETSMAQLMFDSVVVAALLYFVFVAYLWQVTVLAGSAAVSTMMTAAGGSRVCSASVTR